MHLFQEDSTEKPASEKLLLYLKLMLMSVDDEQNLLMLDKDDLFLRYTSKSTRKMLLEAFAIYEANKSWIFKGCFCCDKKFAEAEEHFEHTMKEHVGRLSSEQRSCLPTELDGGWDSVVYTGN